MNDQEPSKKKDLDRKLEKLRVKIDSVDEKLISFLNQRAEIVKEIGEIKKELGYNVFQPNREKDIYQKLEQEPSPLKFKSLKAIWKEIMAASKELQGQILEVGYLGPKGTFTHQAALKYFPKANTEFIACNNIDEIFRDIEKDILNFGAIPIENNFQGTVRETLDLLIEKDLNIYGEIELRIIQNLISHKDAELSDIDKIYSHPQAFAQTRTWIKKHLPNAKLINTASTAEAVYKISSSDSKNIAAIGTDFAAKVYNLKLLRTKIEDHPSNFTRFLMISKQENEERNEKTKTSIVYVTKHKPGALYKVLKLFAEADINLMKIESRPRRKGRWEYIFLMDFEGDKNDKRVQKVFEDMKENVIWFKILGSYPIA